MTQLDPNIKIVSDRRMPTNDEHTLWLKIPHQSYEDKDFSWLEYEPIELIHLCKPNIFAKIITAEKVTAELKQQYAVATGYIRNGVCTTCKLRIDYKPRYFFADFSPLF